MQHPILCAEQDAHLCITQHAMGVHLWPVFDLEGFPGVGLKLHLHNTPVKELGHLLEDTGLGLGRQGNALVLLSETCKVSQACVLGQGGFRTFAAICTRV